MISVTSAQLSAWIAAFLFPLARILALISSSPILGNRQIPVRIKVALGMTLTLLIAPNLDIPPDLQPMSAPGMLILIQQIITGLAMGFAMRVIFTAVEMAGDLAGMQMGLGFASFYDPQNASYTPIVAQFLGILTALAFINMNGHLYMLAVLVDSFQSFPVGGPAPSALSFRMLAEWGSSIFVHALQLALPLIGVLMITNLALGILTRSAPQLNIFAVGFPITLSAGFLILILTLPYLVPLVEKVAFEALEVMANMSKGGG